MNESDSKEVFFFKKLDFEHILDNVDSFKNDENVPDIEIDNVTTTPISYLRLYYETARQGNSTYWRLRCNSNAQRPIGLTYSVRVGNDRPVTFSTTINPGEIKNLGGRHTPPSLSYRYLRLVSAWWD